MIVTENLIITALNPQELKSYLDGRGVEPEEFEYINNMITKLLASDGDLFVYHTFWIGVDKQSQEIVAELVLKGEPVDSEVEIGYTCFQPGKGIMTEMVEGVKFWAEANDIKLMAIAENPASEKVLKKNGFINTGGKTFKTL